MGIEIGDKQFKWFMDFARVHLVGKHPEGFSSMGDLADCWHPDLVQCLELALYLEQVDNFAESLVHLRKAMNALLDSRRPDIAQEYAITAVNTFPGCPYYKLVLGLACMYMGDWAKAKDLFLHYLEVYQDSWEAKYYMAKCHVGLDENDQAIELLESIVQVNNDPAKIPLLASCYAAKGKQIVREIFGKTQNIAISASMACPHLEKALQYLAQYQKTQESSSLESGQDDNQDLRPTVDTLFNETCNVYDELMPGKLQGMGITLSLNRLHRVVLGDLRAELAPAMLDAVFTCNNTVRSAMVLSCTRSSSGRLSSDVLLFQTDDIDRMRQEKPVGWVTISYPGWDDPRQPQVSYSLGKE